MSIQGSLEDVAVAEVLQFVHLGSSTGTLVLTRDDERLEIGFHDGGIINAWDSQSRRLGELLVARRLVSDEVVECALAIQATKRDPVPSIGAVLVQEGFLDPEELRITVVEQIRQSISRAIEWTSGSFVFVKGPPRRRDQFDPDGVLAYKLNTQALLLDIARTLDHARSGLTTQPELWKMADLTSETSERPSGGLTPAALGAESDRDDPDDTGDDIAFPEESAGLPMVRVISDDTGLADELQGIACEVDRRSFRDRLEGLQPARVLVVDMRPARSIGELADLLAASPGGDPVVLVSDVSIAAAAYAQGARAVVPDQHRALAGYIESMLAAGRSAAPARRADSAESHGFARLREVFADLRESAPSATRILGLLRVASDFAQRAAVFVVLGDQVRVIGAFGQSVDGTPLADVLRKIGAFALDGALRQAAERRTVVSTTYDEKLLPRVLADNLGPPANHQFLVVPVTGGEKAILLVYLDNDDQPEPIEGLDVIELAGAHIGLMFENELLKRRFGVSGRERREPTISSSSG